MHPADDKGGAGPTPPLALVAIGHVNHGKTALVRALTGVETDRLKEEADRGMSIVLGFAWRDDGGRIVDLIDAPGHEDFIRAMAMGASGARAALLVVSAVEGVGRQTREHLRIAELFGIDAGVVAVTKCDLLADDDAAPLAARIADELAGTVLANAPVVFCSARTGEGLDTLQAAVRALATDADPSKPPDAWLPLDRVFTVAGAGVVGTGTLQGGALAVGHDVVLQPSGRPAAVRQVQVHGKSVARAPPGGRAAVALRGVSLDEVPTGEVVCRPGAFEPSRLIDVALTVSPENARPLKPLAEVQVLWGARQDMARVRLLDRAPLAPGAAGFAQLSFERPTVAFAGQRGVLRRPSPAETIGGLRVLDPVARPIRGRVDARRTLLQAAASDDLAGVAAALAARDGGLVDLATASRLSGRLADAVVERLKADFAPLDEQRLASNAALANVSEAYLSRLTEAHRAAPMRLWAPAAAVRRSLAGTASRDLLAHVERALAANGRIRLQGAGVALAEHDPFAALSAAALARMTRIEQAYRDGGATPPAPAELEGVTPEDAALLDLLLDSGRLITLRNVSLRQTLIFHPAALEAAAAALRAAFPPPATFTTGEARATLATSRKFIVPVLERFDDLGVTLREGDLRRVTPEQKRVDPAADPL